MIRKIIGSLCILLATTGYGYQKGMIYQEEKEEVERLMQVIWQIKGEMLYTRSNLEDVLLCVSDRIEEPYKTWVSTMAKDMNSRRKSQLTDIWEQQTKANLLKLNLPKEIKTELLDLGKKLNYLDISMQVQSIEWFYERLKLMKKEIDNRLSEKRRLCNLLGVSGGIFLIILLF